MHFDTPMIVGNDKSSHRNLPTTRYQEAMKIMGLSGWVHAVGWYIEIIMVMIIPVILIAICLRYGLYLYSDPSLLFVFLRESATKECDFIKVRKNNKEHIEIVP